MQAACHDTAAIEFSTTVRGPFSLKATAPVTEAKAIFLFGLAASVSLDPMEAQSLATLPFESDPTLDHPDPQHTTNVCRPAQTRWCLEVQMAQEACWKGKNAQGRPLLSLNFLKVRL